MLNRFAPPRRSEAKSERSTRRRAAMKEEMSRLSALNSGRLPPRSTAYDYLWGVLDFYWKLKDQKRRSRAKRILAEMVPGREQRSLLRRIIDATSHRDVKTKSRWAQALAYANKNRSQIQNGWGDDRAGRFDLFIKRNHGISGCAAKMANKRK